MPDPLDGIHDLTNCEVLAGDGHWIEHAGHDPLKRSNKGEEHYYPIGHYYLRDLRRHTLRHLALCDQVSRTKENLPIIRCGDLAWDRADPVNRGVERDEQIGTATAGVMLRRVTHTDPDPWVSRDRL